jgi:hypothetical protein
VVVDSGHDLEVGAVVEQDPTHDVHLPQLHGSIALEAAELVASLLAPPELDEIVTLETAINARTSRQRVDALACELMEDPARSPARVVAADLADQGLEVGADLVGTTLWPVEAIDEAENITRLMAGDPSVDRLTSHSEMVGDLCDLPTPCRTAITA